MTGLDDAPDKGTGVRIAVVNTHPIQYFAPLYRHLNTARDLEVEAIYLTDFSLRGATDRDFGHKVTWDVDLMSGYPSRFVGANYRTAEPYGFFGLVSLALFGALRRDRYDAVWVHGHGHAALMLAVFTAWLRGIPVFMRGETHLGLAMPGWRQSVRRLVMGFLYARCRVMLAIGSANRDFYRAMGVPDHRIALVPYTVDNDRFAAMAEISADERLAWRARLGVMDDLPIILFASKFQGRKRPGDLLEAFLKLRQQGLAAHLVMVGSGELGETLHRRAAEAGDPNVHFPGFFNQSELPPIYAASELFVLPSENEPWGLIINEVMCAGMPVVVSEEVGCVPDLVRDGENGATFPAGNVDALADRIAKLLADAARLRDMGAASRRIISQWSYRECLTGIRDALHKAGITGSNAS